MGELEFSEGSPARLIAHRSFIYGVLAACFQYPDEILTESISTGTLLKGLQGIFNLALAADDINGLAAEVSLEELESEYTQLFEVTSPQGAVCHLYAGLHYGDRMQVMEEHVRFYNFFELHMPDTIEELPDHLCTELEFLQFLCAQEAYAVDKDQEAQSFQNAQQDFISRHMLRWIGSLEQSVEKHATGPFYTSLVRVTGAFLKSEFKRLCNSEDSSVIPSIAVN